MTSVTSIDVCRVEDVPEGQMRQFTVNGADGPIAVANVGGEFFAFEDRCTHGEASLAEEGELAGHTVECGWHGGQFDVRTGQSIASPCSIDLKTYPIVVHEGRLQIHLAN